VKISPNESLQYTGGSGSLAVWESTSLSPRVLGFQVGDNTGVVSTPYPYLSLRDDSLRYVCNSSGDSYLAHQYDSLVAGHTSRVECHNGCQDDGEAMIPRSVCTIGAGSDG